jgi:DnaK suppressor protein
MAKPKPTHTKLKELLTERRRHLAEDVRGRIRDGRNEVPSGQDTGDRSDANFQQALDMTLLQMHAGVLTSIDDALGRIDAGTYGVCVECESAIAEGRLVALPFAMRCRTCEDEREEASGSRQRLRGATRFAHVVS